MDPESLKDDLFALAGYLLTSAAGLYHEPGEYGIYRLLDAAGRLLAIMQTHGLSDEFIDHLGQEIAEEKASSMDHDRQEATVNRVVMEYTDQLQHHLENG